MTDALNLFPNKIHPSNQPIKIDPKHRKLIEEEFNDEDLELLSYSFTPSSAGGMITKEYEDLLKKEGD